MNGKAETRSGRWFIYIKGAFILVWGFLAFLALLARAFAYGYVPSVNWVAATGPYRVAAGIVGTVFIVVFAVKDQPVGIDRTFKKVIGILAAPFVGYFIGSTPILAGGPMLIAAIAGHRVELVYNVKKADGRGDKGCHSPIEFQGLPFLFEEICGIPENLRLALKPGMEIVVEGRGTSLGVYATAFHRVDHEISGKPNLHFASPNLRPAAS